MSLGRQAAERHSTLAVVVDSCWRFTIAGRFIRKLIRSCLANTQKFCCFSLGDPLAQERANGVIFGFCVCSVAVLVFPAALQNAKHFALSLILGAKHLISPRIHIAILSCALAGCTSVTTDTACLSFSPITFSASQDSAETIRQVRAHNAAFESICGR